MKVVALLIFWSFPLLPAEGPGRSPSLAAGLSAHAHADFHVTSAVIQQPFEAGLPGDAGKVSLGSPFWDEEDSLDDLLVESGLLPGPLWWALVKDDRSRFAHPPCDLVRSPSSPLPLRC